VLNVLPYILYGLSVIVALGGCIPFYWAVIRMAPFDWRKVSTRSMVSLVLAMLLIFTALAIQARAYPLIGVRDALMFAGTFVLIYLVFRSTSRTLSEFFEQRNEKLSGQDRSTPEREPESENESGRSLT
jgi:hypothetical protein